MPLIKKLTYLSFAFCLCIGVLSIPSLSHAQSAPIDILPAKSVQDQSLLPRDGSETHPPVKLTPDKSELLKLDEQAGTIIIGNPDSLSVLADSAKTLVLVPKLPGATHITVLNTKGEVIMQRHVIVAAPKERYVRIRRSCAGAESGTCQATQVYYCPGSCHEVRVAEETKEDNNSIFDTLEELTKQGQTEQSDTSDE